MRKALKGLIGGLVIGSALVCSLIALSMWNAGRIGGGAATVLMVLYGGGSLGVLVWVFGKK